MSLDSARDGEPVEPSKGRTSNLLVLLVGCTLALSLAGCFAKQSDLVKQDKDLTAKIDKARADLDQLIGETRARFSQELTTFREEELPALRGNLDKGANRFDAIQRRLDDVENKSSARLDVLEKIQHDQANLLKADRDRAQEELAKLVETIGALAKTVDARLEAYDKANNARADQLTQLSRTLADFKAALAKVADKMGRDEQHLANLSVMVEANSKLTADHMVELNKSVNSVAKALQAAGEAIELREAEQDHRLDEMAKALQGMAAQAGAVKGGKPGTNDKRASSSRGSAGTGQAQAKGSGQAAAAPAAPAPAVVAAGGQAGDSEEQRYEQSLQAFKSGDYDKARKRFSEFLQRHPDSKLAANAHYWLGECYYGTKDYAQAIEAFDRVRRAYPDSAKVPAALLKTGFAYIALNDRGRASSTLKQVVEAYPKSPEAGKALEKLAQLQ